MTQNAYPEWLADRTRDEWRELGFYYDQDEERRQWRLFGSVQGLLGLADLLDAYTQDPRNCRVPEHEHYGPYSYLTIGTGHAACLDERAISGTIEDLQRLRGLVGESLERVGPGQRLAIGSAYYPGAAYDLVLIVEEDDFDPASRDPMLALE